MIAEWQVRDLITLVRQRYPEWDGFAHPKFVDDELTYKYDTIGKAEELLDQGEVKKLLEQADYDTFIERLIKLGRDNNLLWTAQPQRGDLAILHHPNLPKWEFAEQMRTLLYEQRPSPDKLRQFSNFCASHNLPNKWAFATYFLFITRPDVEMFIKPTVAKWFMRFMGVGDLYTTTPNGEMYERYKKHCHGLLAELADYGAADMVHIQSLIWVAQRESKKRTAGLTLEGQIELDRPLPPDDTFAPEEKEEAEEEMAELEPLMMAEPAASYTTEIAPPYSLEMMVDETGYPADTIQGWVDALGRKKQAVFYGPPGTGKTFIAQKLARHLIGGGDGFSELVQFHPAYDYTDFVQGIRPQTTEANTLTYELQSGRFLDFCQRASGRSGSCVLIIDELNRANLSRVLGELMYLLEYRQAEIQLANGTPFTIPDNVLIIGTMNTADRSIALVDHALRRRFAFIPLRPDFDVLRHYHQQTSLNIEPLIQLLARLNREIDDPHYEVGISFFMRPDLPDTLPAIWRWEIEPYLEEYFFGQPERLGRYRWEQVEATVQALMG